MVSGLNNLIMNIGEIIDKILHYKAYRKKLEAETRLVELEGLEKQQQIHRNLIVDQKSMIKALEEEKTKLNEEIDKLHQVSSKF